jgi:hypothetical protein
MERSEAVERLERSVATWLVAMSGEFMLVAIEYRSCAER